MKQTMQPVRTIKQSIYLDVYGSFTLSKCHPVALLALAPWAAQEQIETILFVAVFSKESRQVQPKLLLKTLL